MEPRYAHPGRVIEDRLHRTSAEGDVDEYLAGARPT